MIAVSVGDVRTLADTKSNQVIERQGRRVAQQSRACVGALSKQMPLTDSALGSSQ
jgi:hypothetical protein